MNTTYAHNHLGRLCQQLAENIRNSELDVFAKEVIITQSQGMNAWLNPPAAPQIPILIPIVRLLSHGQNV